MSSKLPIVILLLLLSITSANARLLKEPLPVHEVQCGETFACPESIKGRISFWVDVFSRWETNQAIFHDKERPERVYSTITRTNGCRNSRADNTIEKQRKYLKSLILRTADKVANQKSLSRQENTMATIFSGESVAEMKRAAERIRCQSGNRDRMQAAVQGYKRYRSTILDALESQNLTLELQYLPFVESAFNTEALSHVGAAGLWQIMPATGKTLGLKVNHVVDERYDPYRATYAAAKYFRDSVDDLSQTAISHGHTIVVKELNPFVVTSYNYGVRGMQRAIKQVGLDYERLLAEYKSPNFQTAVKNFYSSFIAARYVAQNIEQFFGDLDEDKSNYIHDYSEVKLPRATSVARIADTLSVDREILKKLNPALKSVVWEGKALVPSNYVLRLPYLEAGWDERIARMQALPKEYERPGYVWHKVKSGQTACGIARKYKASCKQLWRLNGLNKRGTVYAGKRIKVPTKTGGIYTVAQSKQPLVSHNQTSTAYRVQKGDTACNIAERFKMRCAELLAMNGLQRNSIIRIGQQLRVLSSNAWHVVAAGQTACGIAESYRLACSKLLRANGLSSRSIIRVGQRLQLPVN